MKHVPLIVDITPPKGIELAGFHRSPGSKRRVTGIQLAGPGSYVSSARATAGGGYSAIVQSNRVGHQGGQVLVEESVKAINALWPAR